MYGPSNTIKTFPNPSPVGDFALDTEVNNSGTKDPYNSGPIISQNNNYGYTDEAGKINWWKLLKAAVSSLPIIGGLLGELVDQISGKGIDDQDSQIINDWIANVFTPFIRPIAINTQNLLNANFTMASLAEANDILAQLCIIKTYFATNDGATFLTEDGIQARYDIVAASCDELAKQLAAKIAESGLSVALQPVKVNTESYNFGTLMPALKPSIFNCYNYQQGAKGEPVQTITELPVTQSTPINVTIKNEPKRKGVLLVGAILLAWGISEVMTGKKKKAKA